MNLSPAALQAPVEWVCDDTLGSGDPGISVILLQGIDWEFYQETLFSSPEEVHSFLLGVFSGVILLSLVYHGYHRAAFALLIGFVVFAWGFPNVIDLPLPGGEWEHYGTRDVQRKPWYYFSGLLPIFLGLLGIRRLVVGPERDGVADPVHAQLQQVADELDDDATTDDAIRHLIDHYRARADRLLEAESEDVDPTAESEEPSSADGSDESGERSDSR